MAVAAVVAGLVNAVVGSGSLFTFPTLLGFGVPSVTANVSNNLGLVPGNAAAAWGYRDRLSGQRERIIRLLPASVVGSVIGAVLLLSLPASVFATAVPVLIALAVVLVLIQPRLQRRLAHTRGGSAGPSRTGTVLLAGTFAAGIYGGYFGAAQGVLLIGLLGATLPDDLQRLNAVKNVLAFAVNAVAALTFAIAAPGRIDPVIAVTIAVGATIGGVLGAAREAPATTGLPGGDRRGGGGGHRCPGPLSGQSAVSVTEQRVEEGPWAGLDRPRAPANRVRPPGWSAWCCDRPRWARRRVRAVRSGWPHRSSGLLPGRPGAGRCGAPRGPVGSCQRR